MRLRTPTFQIVEADRERCVSPFVLWISVP